MIYKAPTSIKNQGAVNCSCTSYCANNCGSDSDLQFTFPAYSQDTNFDQIFARGTWGRL